MRRPARVTAALALAVSMLTSIGLAAPAQATSSLSFIAVGPNPDGVAVSPDGSRVYVVNTGSNNVSVINTATWSVVSTISVGTGPTGIAVSPDGTRLVVANTQAGTVSIVNSATGAVLHTSSTSSDCPSPTQLAFHPAGSTVYIACGASMRIGYVAVSSGTYTTLSTGARAVNDVAVSASANELIGVGGFHALFVNQAWGPGVNPDPLAVATNADASRTYTPHADGTMSRLDRPAHTVTNYPIGDGLRDVALTSDDQTVYVTDEAGNAVISVNASTMRPIATYPAGTAPRAIALDPRGLFVYAVNTSSNRLAVINLATEASGADVPSAAMQQFARAEYQSCDAAPADLADFPALGAAVRNDAWGASWAQWPNGGTGGYVCTRQPYFTSTGTWAVR